MTRADLVRRCWAPESLAGRWLRARRPKRKGRDANHKAALAREKRKRDTLAAREACTAVALAAQTREQRKRDRVAAILRMLPATLAQLSVATGLSTEQARVECRRLGAAPQAAGVAHGRRLWRMP